MKVVIFYSNFEKLDNIQKKYWCANEKDVYMQISAPCSIATNCAKSLEPMSFNC